MHILLKAEKSGGEVVKSNLTRRCRAPEGQAEAKVNLIHLMNLPSARLAETEYQLTATHAVSH